MLRMIGITVLLASLSACSIFQNSPEQNHHAMCEELKHRIIFNGATPNQTAATQERAGMGTLANSYREQGC